MIAGTLDEVDELSSLAGDFGYELDITEALRDVEVRVKGALRTLDRVDRAAAKIGISL